MQRLGFRATALRLAVAVPRSQDAPRMDIFDVRDTPQGGKKLQFTVASHHLTITHIPQSVARINDPSDPTSQFADELRSMARLRTADIGQLLAVMEGKASSAHIKTNSFDLTVTSMGKSDISIKGKMRSAGGDRETLRDVEADIKGHEATKLHHFLTGAIDHLFGFSRNKALPPSVRWF